jgi:hypothetical protein
MSGPSFNRMNLQLDAVRFTLVSDVIQNTDTGKYVRLIQFFTDAPDQLNPRPVLEVTLTGDQPIDVELQTPKLNF